MLKNLFQILGNARFIGASRNNSLVFHRPLQTTCLLTKEDRRQMILSMPKRDEGVDGEKTVDIDKHLPTRWDMFPDENTPDLLFNGVRFAELPICHIKSTKNNTIMNVTDYKGKQIVLRSCGLEGFKNAKKGTNIAAQATGLSLGRMCLENGVTTLRVKVGHLGPGRMASLKGLQMAGINIVSITDTTPIPWKGPRPKKQRRI